MNDRGVATGGRMRREQARAMDEVLGEDDTQVLNFKICHPAETFSYDTGISDNNYTMQINTNEVSQGRQR